MAPCLNQQTSIAGGHSNAPTPHKQVHDGFFVRLLHMLDLEQLPLLLPLITLWPVPRPELAALPLLSHT